MTENEAILLRRFSTGADAEAFAELTRRYVQMVYSTSWRVLKDDNDATDVTQETFFELTRHAGRISGSLGAWLHRVATQKSIDVIRRSVHRRQRERAYARNRPVEVQSWQDLSEHVDLALDQLDESSRALLLDHFIAGKTTACIAKERGVSQATISRRINAGLERLRGILKRKGLLVTAAALATMLMENTSQAVSGAVMGGLGKMAMVGTTTGASAVTGKIAAIKASLAAAAVVGTLSVAGYVHHRRSIPPLPPLSAHAQMQAISAGRDTSSFYLGDEALGDEAADLEQATVTDGFSSMAETEPDSNDPTPAAAVVEIAESAPPPVVLGPAPEFPAVDRMLHFSSGRSIGIVYAQDVNAAVTDAAPGFDPDPGAASRERLNWARGHVSVPAEKRPILSIRGLEVTPDCYLEAMNALGPDDLYELQFFAVRTVHLRDDLIQPITVLTGLRRLDMATIYVTPQALAYVAQLPYLEALSTPRGLTDQGMAAIVRMPYLKRLKIGPNDMTDAGLRLLGRLRSLEVLDLIGNGAVTDEGLKALAQLPALKHVRLRGTFTDRGMTHLAAMPSLQSLWLNSPRLTDEGLRRLSQSQTLERFGGHSLGKVTGRGLTHLKGMSQLKHIEMQHFRLTDGDMVHLAALPQLRRLHLPGTMTDDGIGHLAGLDQLTELRINGYSPSTLTDKSLGLLSQMGSLKTLEVSGNGFTAAGIEALSHLENLEVLALYSPLGDGLDNESLKHLAKMPKLRDLSVTSNGTVTLSGINALNALGALERLSVNGVRQDGKGLDLSALAQLTHLTITMARRGSSPRSGRAPVSRTFRPGDLASLSALTHLESLLLGGVGIGDDDLAHLSRLKELRSLTLDGGSRLTDIGAERLANLPRLQRLHIYDSRITEQGLACLSPLKTLQGVYLHSAVSIDVQAVVRLQSELPYLQTFSIYSPPRVPRVASNKAKTRRGRTLPAAPAYQPSRSRRRR